MRNKYFFVDESGDSETSKTKLNRINKGDVENIDSDSVKIASLSSTFLNNGVETPVLLNKKNYDLIKAKHPLFSHDDLIETGKNPTDRFIFEKNGEPIKINLIKRNKDGSIFVIGANRFNGYGIITFFDQIDSRRAKNYLESLKRRGKSF